MPEQSLVSIFLSASLINNFVLAYFLGICPFLGVSGKLETAARMGAAVTFVMLVSSLCAYAIHAVLDAIGALTCSCSHSSWSSPRRCNSSRCSSASSARRCFARVRSGGEQMKIEYDQPRDLLYIWFGTPGEKAVKTETVVPGVNADFNAQGVLIGIEVPDASEV